MKSLQNEENLIKIFERCPIFWLNGHLYKLLKPYGKPKSQKSGGEPKTDVYLPFLVDDKEKVEIKISLKMKNFNFTENKLSFGRMRLWGEDTEDVLRSIAASILKNDHEKIDKSLNNPPRHKRKGNKYLLGYRLDITNKPNAKRSYPLGLTTDQKIEFFTGATMEEEKRNSLVSGVMVENSGVANMYLEMNISGEETPQDILKQLIPLDNKMFYERIELFATIKAVNYFPNSPKGSSKYDGPRPLLIQAKYQYDNGTDNIAKSLIVENPLKVTAKDVLEKYHNLLR